MHRNLCCRLDPQCLEEKLSLDDLAAQVSCSHQCHSGEEMSIALSSEVLQIQKVVHCLCENKTKQQQGLMTPYFKSEHQNL